jgi:hypothetical protein
MLEGTSGFYYVSSIFEKSSRKFDCDTMTTPFDFFPLVLEYKHNFSFASQVGAVQAYKLVKFTRQLMRVAGLVKYDFDIANRLYFNEDENVRSCIKDIFNEDIEMLNFSFQPVEARTRINQWVEDVTNNKIKDLVTADTINANTRIALVTFPWKSLKCNLAISSCMFFLANNRLMQLTLKGSGPRSSK